jgi:hypothetical protein
MGPTSTWRPARRSAARAQRRRQELILITGMTFSGQRPRARQGGDGLGAICDCRPGLAHPYPPGLGSCCPPRSWRLAFPGRLTPWISTARMLMVAGLVAMSAGFDETIEPSFGHTDPVAVRVPGVQPGVLVAADRRGPPRRFDSGDGPYAASGGRHRGYGRPARSRRRVRGLQPARSRQRSD